MDGWMEDAQKSGLTLKKIIRRFHIELQHYASQRTTIVVAYEPFLTLKIANREAATALPRPLSYRTDVFQRQPIILAFYATWYRQRLMRLPWAQGLTEARTQWALM